MKDSLISIVIPALNEESNIERVYEKISQILKDEKTEIIFVDDGSVDGTLKAIEQLVQRHANIKGLSFSRNFGHQAAIKAGLDHATGDCVITLDCDLEHPPEYILQMLSHWREGSEVVISTRNSSQHLPLLKKLSSKVFYTLLNSISDVPIRTGSADFRLLDKKVVLACRNIHESELFWRGIIPWLGFKTTYIRYDQGLRESGESKYTLAKMLRLSTSGITSSSVRPLFLSFYLGVILTSISFCYLLFQFGKSLINASEPTGWKTIIASILFIGGLELVALGILGIYLGKLVTQLKGRPPYILSRIVSNSKQEAELKKAG
jgi:dolichol-phosphate mannosyltransferase